MNPEIHRARLREVFLIRPQNQGVPEFIVSGMLRNSIATCYDSINKKVPMSVGGPMSVFLEFDGWYGDEQIKDLFAAYVRADYITMNSGPEGQLLPLEVAIDWSHVDFIRAAVDNGADDRLVPTPGNSTRYCHGDDEPTELNDIFDVVANDVSSEAIALQLTAMFRAIVMSRQIDEANASVSKVAVPAAQKQRRAQL